MDDVIVLCDSDGEDAQTQEQQQQQQRQQKPNQVGHSSVALRVKLSRKRKPTTLFEQQNVSVVSEKKKMKKRMPPCSRAAMKEIQNTRDLDSDMDDFVEEMVNVKHPDEQEKKKNEDEDGYVKLEEGGSDHDEQMKKTKKKKDKKKSKNQDEDGHVKILEASRKKKKQEEEGGRKDDGCTKSQAKVKKRGPKKEPVAAAAATVVCIADDDDDFALEPAVNLVESDEDDEKSSADKGTEEAVPHRKADKLSVEGHFIGRPVPAAQARKRWPHRFNQKDGETPQCAAHYEEAVVDGEYYKVGDCVSVNGDGGEYLGKALEFFRTVNDENWFRIQWFFRFSDTTIGSLDDVPMDEKRIFYSDVEDDNYLVCITGKVNVAYSSPSNNFLKRAKANQECDFYFDMGFRSELSTYHKLPDFESSSDAKSTVSDENSSEQASVESGLKTDAGASTDKTLKTKTELALLDLYSGCGGMSTGLCMGTALGGVNLVTRWALDLNEHACESMKYNHPETEVRNEDAESFLHLLKEWQKLCTIFEGRLPVLDSDSKADKRKPASDEYEVEKIVGIRVAELDKGSKRTSTSSKMPEKPAKRQLEYKVHWKGYTDDSDSWEPVENVEDCQERIREFVTEGRKRRLLPLPGEVDVICGGPPCQGASGFNRFRNKTAPLNCPRNRQMMIYMDIVEFLRPKFVLMENVVDILKFCGGILGRYAMFRLVNMHYQAKLGLMVAGSFGLPQFRMRVFLWGAAPSETLPAFPLPTHEVVYRGAVPQDYLRNVVKHEEQDTELEPALLLKDAIFDLPPVENSEKRNELPYRQEPNSEFQRYIRSAKHVFYARNAEYERNKVLFDHRPLQLNEDDYQRTCRIPRKKGANFRDLGGLKVRDDNIVELDLDVKREYLPSGKPLVPDYAISFVKGRSLKPFARLWWDETVPTVVTRAEPHNQRILHPTQDRVLTIRENARLQGFPDWYKLSGPVKERYTQVGNAVAVPVARALGYSLALATRQGREEPLLQLPRGFPSF